MKMRKKKRKDTRRATMYTPTPNSLAKKMKSMWYRSQMIRAQRYACLRAESMLSTVPISSTPNVFRFFLWLSQASSYRNWITEAQSVSTKTVRFDEKYSICSEERMTFHIVHCSSCVHSQLARNFIPNYHVACHPVDFYVYCNLNTCPELETFIMCSTQNGCPKQIKQTEWEKDKNHSENKWARTYVLSVFVSWSWSSRSRFLACSLTHSLSLSICICWLLLCSMRVADYSDSIIIVLERVYRGAWISDEQ